LRVAILCALIVIALAGVLGPAAGPKPAFGQSVILCPAGSTGNAYAYGSMTSCPIPASLATSSTLNKYFGPPYSGYLMLKSTYSACGPGCFYDATFDSNGQGAGYYYTGGTHNTSAPGYSPGFALSVWYFTV
jgi:hypothetical protein